MVRKNLLSDHTMESAAPAQGLWEMGQTMPSTNSRSHRLPLLLSDSLCCWPEKTATWRKRYSTFWSHDAHIGEIQLCPLH